MHLRAELPASAGCVADDWGMSPGVNAGILKLCGTGLLRGVSLFGNLGHTAEGLDRLLGAGGLEFSLHLNFTYGRPLSRPEEVPSLCGPGGFFRGLPALLLLAARGRLPAGELRAEAGRQVRRLKELGVPLTGLEGHHHAHLVPGVFAALAPLLREEGLTWARLPADKAHLPSWLSGKIFKRWFLSSPGPAAGFELRPTLYLRRADTRTAAALEKKIFNRAGLPVITHPALENDLPRMEHPDGYRQERVLELGKLLELAAAREALRA